QEKSPVERATHHNCDAAHHRTNVRSVQKAASRRAKRSAAMSLDGGVGEPPQSTGGRRGIAWEHRKGRERAYGRITSGAPISSPPASSAPPSRRRFGPNE